MSQMARLRCLLTACVLLSLCVSLHHSAAVRTADADPPTLTRITPDATNLPDGTINKYGNNDGSIHPHGNTHPTHAGGSRSEYTSEPFAHTTHPRCHFDINLAWTTHVGSSVVSTPRVVHAAHDGGGGGKDILIPTFTHFVEALSGATGEDVMGFPFTHTRYKSYGSPVAVDMSRRGTNELMWLVGLYSGELLVLGADGEARGVIRLPALAVRRDWTAASESTPLAELAHIRVAAPTGEEKAQWRALREAHRVRRWHEPFAPSPRRQQGGVHRATDDGVDDADDDATEHTLGATHTNIHNNNNKNDNDKNNNKTNKKNNDMVDDYENTMDVHRADTMHDDDDGEYHRTITTQVGRDSRRGAEQRQRLDEEDEKEDWADWDMEDDIAALYDGTTAPHRNSGGHAGSHSNPPTTDDSARILSPEARAAWSLLCDAAPVSSTAAAADTGYTDEAHGWHRALDSLRPPIRTVSNPAEEFTLPPHLLSSPVVADVNNDDELDVVMHVSYVDESATSANASSSAFAASSLPLVTRASAVVCMNLVTGQLHWVHVLRLTAEPMANTTSHPIPRSPTLHRYRIGVYEWFTVVYVSTDWGEVVALSGLDGQLWDGNVPTHTTAAATADYTHERDATEYTIDHAAAAAAEALLTKLDTDAAPRNAHEANIGPTQTIETTQKQSAEPTAAWRTRPDEHRPYRTNPPTRTTRPIAATTTAWSRPAGRHAALYAGVTVAAVPTLPSAPRVSVCVGDADGWVRCFSPHGELRWAQRLRGAVVARVTVGDVDGDGAVEVCVGTLEGFVYALRADNGAVLRHFPVRTHGAIVAPVALIAMGGRGRGRGLLRRRGGTARHTRPDTEQTRADDRDANHLNSNHTNNKTTGETEKEEARTNVNNHHGRTSGRRSDDTSGDGGARRGGAIRDESPAVPASGGGLQLVVASHDGRVYLIDGRTGCVDTLDLDEASSTMVLADDFQGQGRLQLLVTTLSGGVYLFDTAARAHPRRRWSTAGGYRVSVPDASLLGGAGAGQTGVWIDAAHRRWRDVVGDRMTLRVCIVDDTAARAAVWPSDASSRRTERGRRRDAPTAYVVRVYVDARDEVHRAVYARPGTYTIPMPTPRDRRANAVVTVVLTVSTTGQMYSDSIVRSFNMHYLETIQFTLVAPFVLFCAALMLVHKRHEHPNPVYEEEGIMV